MERPSAEDWARLLQSRDEASLAGLANLLGFAEARKTAANLTLLYDVYPDPELLFATTLAALTAADADLALNNLERLTGTVAAGKLKSVLERSEQRDKLLKVLGASPFLAGILCRKPVFFDDLFTADEFGIAKDEERMLGELRSRIPDTADFPELQKALRIYKYREILRIGSRDLCGLASLEEVTAELTHLAAATLQRACEVCRKLLNSEYGEPLLEAKDGEEPEQAELTVLGMGKFGGCELNFSSDIDVIYFYSSDRGRTTGVADPTGSLHNSIPVHKYFVRLAEMLTRAIGQVTEDGFVFRVDLRLRPEGNSGEMANSLLAAEIYYESWGQSWERSAMLKARPVAGSKRLGETLLQRLEPFVYRRHLDYAMIEDIKTMKQKIDHSLTREREGELNLKLGRGGIREIEFFIQALQLIYAGKNPALRERNSLRALALLREEGLIKPEECGQLSEAYRFLRTVEHRIQVFMEQQTHNLPGRENDLLHLARRCGFDNTPDFQVELQRHRNVVYAMFRDLFYTSEEELPSQVNPRVAFLFNAESDPDQCKDILEEKGFKNPEAAYESLLLLREGGGFRPLTERARRELNRIAPLLFQEVLASPDPPMALRSLEQFLVACRRARGTYYALLAENPGVIKTLVSLFATSQFLSHIFIQHPEILDTLVASSHAVSDKDSEILQESLAEHLHAAGSYEDKLEALRRFRNEEFLRIALNDIQGNTPQGRTTRQLSLVAEVCLQQALVIAQEELVPRFGLPFCQGHGSRDHQATFAIIGLGKLGGRELNYHSDLDIIFIYEGDGETRQVTGTDPARFKPQSNQQYFARLAQRIISVLTLMTREGSLYQIDTRLRPSGNQGPLVTSLPSYRAYHETSAAPWERQALLKARVVAGDPGLAKSIEALTRQIVYERPLPDDLADEIFRLRQRMEKELAKEDDQHRNIKTGHGGMVDVEFLVQYLQLLHGRDFPSLRSKNTLDALQALHADGLLPDEDYKPLENGYKFLRRLENKLRLVHNQSINQLSADPDSLTKLAKHLGYDNTSGSPEQIFLHDYSQITEDIRRIFQHYLKGSGGTGT
jgi:glutamate-ammonia-ligase adenylyltransferase